MKWPDKDHPFWETMDRLILLGFLTVMMILFATNFDASEIKVLAAFAFALTASGATKEKLKRWLTKEDCNGPEGSG